MVAFNTLTGEPPIVIAHRGASGLRPEHTLEAYQLAMELGADFIEPDVVATKDGVLICRHENELSGTTDVADHPEFADRMTTKVIDGVTITGWFAEDFTLAEIKTLRAEERIPDIRPDNAAFDGQFEIPTLDEVIQLVKDFEAETGRQVGIYPETKHPTHYEYTGTTVDGAPIGTSLSQLLVDALVANDFTDPDRVFIQSFELANLIELQTEIMPAAGIDIPLIQLYSGNSVPPDIAFHLNPTNAGNGARPELYNGLPVSPTSTYIDLASAASLQAMADLYAEGVGPSTGLILPRVPVNPPVDGNGDGVAEITTRLTGEVTSFIEDAHAAGLAVHPYTLRNEEVFLTLNPDGTPQTVEEQYQQLIELGVDGFFTDFTGTGREVLQAFLESDGTAGDDEVNGTRDMDFIFGLAGDDELSGGGGDDHLDGGAGEDELNGGLGDDALLGGAGEDELNGAGGDDLMDGGAGEDELTGGAGDDRLFAAAGDDELTGGAGDDRLDGGAGEDELAGGAGDDVLTGGAGDDEIDGGSGDDVFVFVPGSGHDVVEGFKAGARGDVVDLSAYGIGSFDELLGNASEDDGDTTIVLGDDASLQLVGVKINQLQEDDFRLA